MSAHADKFLPVPGPETEPFWAGCRAGELRVQRCTGCGQHQFYPRTLCTACASTALEWIAVSGHGTVLSFTVVHRPLSAAYAGEVPYVVALVRLREGPTLMSNIIGGEAQALRVGAPVQVVFERWTADITIPKFELRD